MPCHTNFYLISELTSRVLQREREEFYPKFALCVAAKLSKGMVCLLRHYIDFELFCVILIIISHLYPFIIILSHLCYLFPEPNHDICLPHTCLDAEFGWHAERSTE